MSRTEKSRLLGQLRLQAEGEKTLKLADIKEAFEAQTGHPVNDHWVYDALRRNRWHWKGKWMPPEILATKNET